MSPPFLFHRRQCRHDSHHCEQDVDAPSREPLDPVRSPRAADQPCARLRAFSCLTSGLARAPPYFRPVSLRFSPKVDTSGKGWTLHKLSAIDPLDVVVNGSRVRCRCSLLDETLGSAAMPQLILRFPFSMSLCPLLSFFFPPFLPAFPSSLTHSTSMPCRRACLTRIRRRATRWTLVLWTPPWCPSATPTRSQPPAAHGSPTRARASFHAFTTTFGGA